MDRRYTTLLQWNGRNMQRNGTHDFYHKAAAYIQRYELRVFFLVLCLIILAHWSYLLVVGAINGQPLSWHQSGLIAFSNWVLYTPLFLAGRAVMDSMKTSRSSRKTILVLMLAIGLAVIFVWQTFTVLKIVPSGHSFTHILGAKARAELIQGLIFTGLLFGLLNLARHPQAKSPPPFIQVKDGTKIHHIPSGDILYLQAEDYYVRLHTSGKSFLIRRPLYELLDTLSGFGFVKVNRSSVVSLRSIKALSTDKKGGLIAEMTNGHELKVGKSFRKELKQAWSATAHTAA